MAQGKSLASDSHHRSDGGPRKPRRDAPSVRAVRLVLADRPLTAADIRHASGLPRRTVYAALRTLDRRGVLRQRGSLHDSRQTFYWLGCDASVDELSHAKDLSLPGLSLESVGRP